MNYDWSWSIFLALSPDGAHPYWKTLVIGTGWTLALAIVSCALALPLGCVLALMRTCSSPGLRLAGAAYIEVFRNIPLLVQMFLWYFVLPELLPAPWGQAIKQMQAPWGQFIPALLCLVFYGTARMSEQIRSGIASLPRGQFQASQAMGMTEWQACRHVILPQALRISLAPLTSEFMSSIKYSSLALTIGLLELTGQANSMQESSFRIFEAFSAATAIYLVLNLGVSTAMRALERHAAIPGLIQARAKPGH